MVVRERRRVGGTELRVSSPYRSGGTGRALTVIVCIAVDVGLAWIGLDSGFWMGFAALPELWSEIL
jgi:hypothetical protein